MRQYDTSHYKFHQRVENAFLFLHLKRWRGIATIRHAKNTALFLVAVYIRRIGLTE